jgi:hypothetical protein
MGCGSWAATGSPASERLPPSVLHGPEHEDTTLDAPVNVQAWGICAAP